MARKTKEITQEPVPSILVRSKQEVKDLIENQIKAADALIAFEVPFNQVYTGYDVFGQGGRKTKEYNEEKKNEFFNEYHKWDNRNKEILTRIYQDANNTDLYGYINSASNYFWSDVVKEQKEDIGHQVAYLQGYIDRLDLIPSASHDVLTVANSFAVCANKVFIVHGHAESLKIETARSLELMGLKAIILHEQEDMGKTIIEKFESNAMDIGFAVILLTADDLGVSKKDAQKSKSEGKEVALALRARQNVVFEMGYFMGKLDRAHVFLLLEEGVEKPGDLDGIVYQNVDSEGMWKIKLAKRLKSVGYTVNVDAIL